ncbi:hypothetical protein ACH5RR_041500 [Cinchona calisaya]|uniref:Uncharacterized protein n=1 Tax=Cinchona calisaya TaxID=153742 RepID=A0ABD2XZ64_9GENT
MLKDYLLDDLSSCSSSGFRTFPRKQQYCCTTTIRFLLEIDLKNNKPMKPTKYIKKQATLSSSSTSLSAFQRAINAVKSFPFAGVNRSACSSNKLKLPRSLSRKLFKRSFWKRSATDYRKEIKRREPIKKLSVQKESPVLDFAGSTPVTGDSHSSTSESNRKSYSWSDSDFTVSDYSSGNSSEVKISKNNNFNDVVSRKDKVVNSHKVGGIVGGDDSVDSTTSSNNIKLLSVVEPP